MLLLSSGEQEAQESQSWGSTNCRDKLQTSLEADLEERRALIIFLGRRGVSGQSGEVSCSVMLVRCEVLRWSYVDCKPDRYL